MLIAEAKREQMERARYQFFHSGAEDYSVFPKVVYDSWKRSLAYGLDPEKQSVKGSRRRSWRPAAGKTRC